MRARTFLTIAVLGIFGILQLGLRSACATRQGDPPTSDTLCFDVPGTADIFLAGRPDGTELLTVFPEPDVAPGNSPVGIPVTAGSVLEIRATGATNNENIPPLSTFTPDGGRSTCWPNITGGPYFGISAIDGMPINSLVGVFIGEDAPRWPAPAEIPPPAFTSPRPLLQQVFFIGDGNGDATGHGGLLYFVVPRGATRLFLGSADSGGSNYNNSNSSFHVEVRRKSDFLEVPGSADIFLAGQPEGTQLDGGLPSPDMVPAQAPVSVPVTAGSVLTFCALGGANNTPDPPLDSFTPDGGQSTSSTLITGGARLGVSALDGFPLNSLVGVFLADSAPQDPAPAAASPPGFCPSQPALQQSFFIGDGAGDAAGQGGMLRVIAPDGATRLLLGCADSPGQNNDNRGGFQVIIESHPFAWEVPGTADIFLAGQPDGTELLTSDPDPDVARGNSPMLIPVRGGSTLSFIVTGATNNENVPPLSDFTPDGGRSTCMPDIGGGAHLGISSIDGFPINSLIGVFLDDQPATEPAPPPVPGPGFTTATLSLQQAFFIGDGVGDATGQGEILEIHVPENATRLFLGSADSGGTNSNNYSSWFEVIVSESRAQLMKISSEPKQPAAAQSLWTLY